MSSLTKDHRLTQMYQLTWISETGEKHYEDYDCTEPDILRLATEKLSKERRPIAIWARKPVASVSFEPKVDRYE